MSARSTMTIRLSPTTRHALGELAHSTGRSRSSLAIEAIEGYVALHRRQVAGIVAAITGADASEPAVAHADVARWLDSRGTEAERRPPLPPA